MPTCGQGTCTSGGDALPKCERGGDGGSRRSGPPHADDRDRCHGHGHGHDLRRWSVNHHGDGRRSPSPWRKR